MDDNDRMRSHDPETIAEAWRLQQLGIDATNAGRPKLGRDHLRAGLKVMDWIEGTVYVAGREAKAVVARLLSSLAYSEAELGAAQYGLSLLDTAMKYAAPEHRGLLVNQRGLVLWRSGNNLAALECFASAEPLLRDIGAYPLGAMLLNRGTVLGELGRYREARGDLRRCAELARQHELTGLSAKALHSQGIVERGIGDVPSALSLYTEAERLYQEVAPDMAPLLAISIASALRWAGLKQEAASRLDTAIEVLDGQKRIRELLNGEVHRARIALESGDPELAAELAARAERRAADLGSDALADWAQHVRREAEFRLGQVDEEFARQTMALAQRQRALRQQDIAELAELLAARAFIAIGQSTQATEILARPSRMASAHVQVAKLTRQLARAELAQARGDEPEALSRLRIGLAGLHQHRKTFGSLELQTGVASLGAELAELGLGLALHTNRPSTVFTWSERSRAQAYRLPAVKPPEDPEAADLLAQTRHLHDAIREAEQEGREVTEERAKVRKLERRLRERNWQLSGPGDSVPEVRHRQIHEELRACDAAMVGFLRHSGQLHALTLINGRTRQYSLGPMTEIEETLRRLLADLNALTGRRLPTRMAEVVQRSIHRQSRQLEDLLFAQFRSRLGDRDLVIVPTGLLAALPWGLLPALQSRPVTVAPSASVWWAAKRRPDSGPARPLLASGPDLTHAETELDSIAKFYPEPVVLQGESANPTAILAALDGAPIAHLAAHGHHNPDNVLFSRLDFDDGPLSAYDIARLATPPAHVTLSACDVGQSKVVIGEETLGFTAALLYAGTRTVVSSVAKVEHRAAAEVMITYHRGIVDGLPPARALADAVARQPLAPFVCYGAS